MQNDVKAAAQAKPLPLLNDKINKGAKPKLRSSGPSLLPCKFCELELPKTELEEHEDYCGSRTDKCIECGQLVMFKDKDMHYISNHSFAKLNQNHGK